jgi:hypothetical protein
VFAFAAERLATGHQVAGADLPKSLRGQFGGACLGQPLTPDDNFLLVQIDIFDRGA